MEEVWFILLSYSYLMKSLSKHGLKCMDETIVELRMLSTKVKL